MKRLRRILAMLLTLLLCVGEFAATGLTVHAADEYDLWVGGVRVTSDNKDDIPGVTGEGAKASYDPDTKTLTFKNVTGITGDCIDWPGGEDDVPYIKIVADDDLTIAGDASIECDAFYSSYSVNTLTIDGNINITAHSSHSMTAIYCGDLVIKSGSLSVTAFEQEAIWAKNLTVEGGSLIAESDDICSMHTTNSLRIKSGYFEAINRNTNGIAVKAPSIYWADAMQLCIPEEGKVVDYNSYYKTIADKDNNPAKHVVLETFEEYDLWVGGVRVTSDNKDDIPGVTGEGAKASYDPEKNTLTFDNATIANAYNYNSGRKAGIYAENIPLTIKGKVSIVPEGIDSTFFGVYLKGTGTQKLTFDGDVTISGYNNGVLGENAEIVIADGKVDINSSKCAYQSNVGITLGEDVEVLSPAGTEFKVLDGYYFLVDSASGTRIAKATIGTTKASYTVTFNKNGHGDDIAAVMVKEGEKVAKPEAPTATGWVFGGWYTDADCTTEYDFTKAVTGNLELYAKWTTEKVNVSGITLDQTTVSLAEEETVTLTATVVPTDATDKTVTWSSDKTSVATVDADGKVTAVKAGTATITATATNGTDDTEDDKTASCEVTVIEGEAPKVDVSKITLDQSTVSLAEEETVTLTATITPTDATDKTVAWSSNKTGVATVDANGKVTAVKAGTATITVTATNGTDDTTDDKTATCTVTVTEAEAPKTDITGITLNKTSVTLEEGKTESLTATVTPEDATDKTVTWTSSDEAVATVDADSKVTAVAAGTATITVTATNGTEDTADDKTATCEVTVTAATEPKTDITGVTLDKAELTVEEGKTETLAATVAPEDASSKDVIWSSSDDTVATIDADGVVVAVKAGTATITVTATNGTEDTADDKTATCEVTVTEAAVKTDITGITLDKTTVSLEVEQIETLTVTVEPEEETDKNVTFKSSDEKIATVDEEGKITAVAEGSTVIIVTADNGTAEAEDDKTATCIVTVTAKKTSPEIPEKGTALVKDDQGKLVYYKDGELQKDYSGLVNVDGTWYYVEKGVLSETKTGFVMYEDGLFLVVEGKLLTSKSGLVQDPYNPDIWYFLADGQVQTQYTGLALYDGEWFYVNKGRLDTTIAAYIEYDGGLFYVAAGRILKEVSGLAQDPNGPDWYYLAEGQAQTQYTGLALYDGEWFYVVYGKLAEDYTGTVEYDGSEFNVVNGMVK